MHWAHRLYFGLVGHGEGAGESKGGGVGGGESLAENVNVIKLSETWILHINSLSLGATYLLNKHNLY
jgi:hypothetical protein